MTLSADRKANLLPAIATSLFSLSACGGGGGGAVGLNPISAPPPAPPPPPSPTPTPTPGPALPTTPAQIALTSSEPFVSLGIGDRYTVSPTGGDERVLSGPDRSESVQFTYLPATKAYQVSIPGFQTGELRLVGLSGSSGQPATSTVHKVTTGSSETLQQLNVTVQTPGNSFSPYTYSSFGSWLGALGKTADGREIYGEGVFAYGIPTRPSEIPITGSATYSAQIFGSIGNGYSLTVSGDASLSFDFAAGTLTGFMHPGIFDYFDGIVQDYGRYDFTQTVYSTGSASFSGKFIVPGLPDGTASSFFEGAFTGPAAAELIARWQAPYVFDGKQGVMSGAWIGKKN